MAKVNEKFLLTHTTVWFIATVEMRHSTALWHTKYVHVTPMNCGCVYGRHV